LPEPRKFKLSLRARLLLALLVLLLGTITAVGLLRSFTAPRQGYAGPYEQPIAFSHKLHAGDKQIDCQYCHTAARRSTSAGLPSVERCMGCHEYVAVRKPEIRKLADYREKKQPIPWVRVHRLPDFVYFSHKRHVLGGVACQTCHGPVQRMENVYQFSSLEMGWCLSCHQQPRGTDVNVMAMTRASLNAQTEGESRAPLDCTTGHKWAV